MAWGLISATRPKATNLREVMDGQARERRILQLDEADSELQAALKASSAMVELQCSLCTFINGSKSTRCQLCNTLLSESNSAVVSSGKEIVILGGGEASVNPTERPKQIEESETREKAIGEEEQSVFLNADTICEHHDYDLAHALRLQEEENALAALSFAQKLVDGRDEMWKARHRSVSAVLQFDVESADDDATSLDEDDFESHLAHSDGSIVTKHDATLNGRHNARAASTLMGKIGTFGGSVG